MITTSNDHNSQTAKSPPQQWVPPHFCFQRQVASPNKISHNSQIHHQPSGQVHHPPSQQEPSPNTRQTHTATEPQPMTNNPTKGCQPPASVYQPQSGYPENDQPPTHHTADSSQRDSADHQSTPLDDSVLQPQSRSPHSTPAEGQLLSAKVTSHLPASHSSSSGSQLCDDHIVLDSSEAAANQQVPEAAPVQFLQLRRPQCSRITAQLVPERLAVRPTNHGGSCRHRDQAAKADQMDVDATPGNDPIPQRHKTAGKLGPVEYHNMHISGWVSVKTLQSSYSMLVNYILNQNHIKACVCTSASVGFDAMHLHSVFDRYILQRLVTIVSM